MGARAGALWTPPSESHGAPLFQRKTGGTSRARPITVNVTRGGGRREAGGARRSRPGGRTSQLPHSSQKKSGNTTPFPHDALPVGLLVGSSSQRKHKLGSRFSGAPQESLPSLGRCWGAAVPGRFAAMGDAHWLDLDLFSVGCVIVFASFLDIHQE